MLDNFRNFQSEVNNRMKEQRDQNNQALLKFEDDRAQWFKQAGDKSDDSSGIFRNLLVNIEKKVEEES